MSSDLQILLSLIALVGVIVAPIIAGVVGEQQARRRERHAYIDSIVKSLIEVRANLHYYKLWEHELNVANEEADNASDNDTREYMTAKFFEVYKSEAFKEMQVNLGRAYSIMISVDDPDIRAQAHVILDTLDPNEKLKVIDFALEELGKKY